MLLDREHNSGVANQLVYFVFQSMDYRLEIFQVSKVVERKDERFRLFCVVVSVVHFVDCFVFEIGEFVWFVTAVDEVLDALVDFDRLCFFF